MTGDGVNDAPALKQSQVGIAVAGATDVARSAADIVLLSPGLSVVVDAIVESRRIFNRMMTFVTYRISATIHMLIFMTFAIIFFDFYLPAMLIIFIVLLNDFTVITIAFDYASYTLKPSRFQWGAMIRNCVMFGSFLVFSSFLLLYLGEVQLGFGDENGRGIVYGMIYLQISICQQLLIISTRASYTSFLGQKPSFILFGTILLTQLFATFVAVYGIVGNKPIGWKNAGIVWGYCVAVFFGIDTIKQMMNASWLNHSSQIF